LKGLRPWYESRLGRQTVELYVNGARLSSYFVELGDGPRLELMHAGKSRTRAVCPRRVLARLARARRRTRGGAQNGRRPRTTGDGYDEAVVLDPDGDRVELTA
jgi:lactoylglutathione lyase